ncbi:MAG: hypothetical protein ACD_22C00061G0003 [uncultured bacterium]|nr:MAG: hypothetical protein ACD_22C00061G0003 [uncultured bacterium]
MFFDTNVAPFGYAWVFNSGKDHYKIGITEADVDPSCKLPSLDERLEKFIDLLQVREDVEFIEKHGGSIHVYKHCPIVGYKNVLAVGDSAGGIHSLTGEGIRHGIVSAKLAVDAIANSHAKNSSNALSEYKRTWLKHRGIRWLTSYIFGDVLYRRNSKYSQKFYYQLVRLCTAKLSIEDAVNLVYNYNYGTILSKFPANLSLIKTFLLALFLSKR